MNFIKSLATKSYRVASQPIRWIWSQAARRSKRYPLCVLFYHRVSDTYPNPWTISTAEFERQLDWLQQRFDIVSLEEIQRRIRHGNDRPTVAITFDDGYADNLLTAIPLLVNRQIPATYFVSTEFVVSGKPFPHDVKAGQELPPNGLESLRLMSRAGIEIGAHSRHHVDLGTVDDPARLFDEVITATRELESEIGQSIRYFAFPFGQHANLNQEAFVLAKQHGFEAVCSAYGGYNEVGGDDFHLQRIHGDPEFIRFENWMSLDPRMAFTRRFISPDLSGIEPENGKTPERAAETTGASTMATPSAS